MSRKGYIKLHRSLLDWEWWPDHKVTRLFIHLLLHVNYEDKKWLGTKIKAGSIATSWESLSKQSGLSVQNIRTAIKKLESTGDLTRKVTNKYQVITIVNWGKYQDSETSANNQLTNNQQTTNNQLTTTKEYKESKEINNNPLSPFEAKWREWKEYRLEQHGFKYKSDKSEKAMLTQLKNLSGGDDNTAIKIIDQSIARGWKGFFQLDTKQKKKSTSDHLKVYF